MVEWHHEFKEQELRHALGDGEGQGGLACCSPRGHRVRHDLESIQQQITFISVGFVKIDILTFFFFSIYIYFIIIIVIIFLLYNIVLVLPYINMHPLRVYTCSPFLHFSLDDLKLT